MNPPYNSFVCVNHSTSNRATLLARTPAPFPSSHVPVYAVKFDDGSITSGLRGDPAKLRLTAGGRIDNLKAGDRIEVSKQ